MTNDQQLWVLVGITFLVGAFIGFLIGFIVGVRRS